MVDQPSPLTYGTVIASLVDLIADTADAGETPDMTLLNGTATITPNIRVFRIVDGVPRIAIKTNQVAKIVAGSLLAPDGITPLRMLATDSPGISPEGLQYTATFELTGVTINPPPISFYLPGGTTVDLATIVNLPAPTPTVVVVSDATRIAAEEAAFEAEQWANIAMANNGNMVILEANDPVPPGTPENTVIIKKIG